MTRAIKWIIISLFVYVVILLGAFVMAAGVTVATTDPAELRTQAVIRDETEGYVLRTLWACKSPDVFDMTIDIAQSGDDERFAEYAARAITTGECVTLHRGHVVFVQSVERTRWRALIRPQGGVQEYWVAYDGLAR